MGVVDWLRRRRRPTDPPEEPKSRTGAAASVVQRAPGVATVLEEVEAGRGHSVLDLGPAMDSSLQVYSRFARRIRFADLLAEVESSAGRARAPREIPEQPDDPYDLVFAWDVLDRLFPEERPGVVARIAEVTRSSSRIHLLVNAGDSGEARPRNFALLDIDRLQYYPAQSAPTGRQPLLPAEVERLVAPFRIVRAFTLKGGLREYVGVRGED